MRFNNCKENVRRIIWYVSRTYQLIRFNKSVKNFRRIISHVSKTYQIIRFTRCKENVRRIISYVSKTVGVWGWESYSNLSKIWVRWAYIGKNAYFFLKIWDKTRCIWECVSRAFEWCKFYEISWFMTGLRARKFFSKIWVRFSKILIVRWIWVTVIFDISSTAILISMYFACINVSIDFLYIYYMFQVELGRDWSRLGKMRNCWNWAF